MGGIRNKRLELMDAMKAFTYGSAYAGGMENYGRQARPWIFRRFACAGLRYLSIVKRKRLKDMLPRATMVGGEWVWGGVRRGTVEIRKLLIFATRYSITNLIHKKYK